MPLQRRRFLFLTNHQIGRADRRLVAAVVRSLEKRGASVEHARSPADAALRHGASPDAVVAAGGDGTIRVLAAAAGASGAVLGIVPAGTANVMALDLELPKSAAGIAAMLMTGPVVEIESGLVNGAPCYVMCGIGFDAEVTRRVSLRLKKYLGRLAYIPAVLSVLLEPVRTFQIELDGKAIGASWVILTNAMHYAGRFRVTETGSVLEPGFSALVLCSRSRLGRIREILAIGLGRGAAVADMLIRNVRTARVLEDVPVQVDGDFLSSGCVEFTAPGASLRLIVPAPPRHPSRSGQW